MPASTRSTETVLTTTVLEAFLASGWILGLDRERIMIGWSAPYEKSSNVRLYAPDFYLSNFQESLNEDSAGSAQSGYQILERSQLRSRLEAALLPKVNLPLMWTEPARSDFDRQFALIQEGFEKRGLKKAVPVVFASAKAETTPEFRLHVLQNALSQPPHLFPYGTWDQKSGIIGVTPEILFTQTDRVCIETVALAGTRMKTSNPEADQQAFLEDLKERHEHQLVIDDIVEVLSSLGSVTVGQTHAVELPTLFHLKTSISATTSAPTNFLTLMRSLHPTPALGISPRALGFSMMKTWEPPQERCRFGAPFGATFINNGVETCHCLVAIRNIQWRENEIWLGSGCGIVPASDPDREWAELRLKRDSVRRMLQL